MPRQWRLVEGCNLARVPQRVDICGKQPVCQHWWFLLLCFCPGNLDFSLGTLAYGVSVKAGVPWLEKSMDGMMVNATTQPLWQRDDGKCNNPTLVATHYHAALGGKCVCVLEAFHLIWNNWNRCYLGWCLGITLVIFIW